MCFDFEDLTVPNWKAVTQPVSPDRWIGGADGEMSPTKWWLNRLVGLHCWGVMFSGVWSVHSPCPTWAEKGRVRVDDS